MRAIFILLLAANLVFFGYQYLFAEKDNNASSVEIKKNNNPSNAGLQLLSEQEGGAVLKIRRQADTKKIVRSSEAISEEKSGQEFCTMLGPYGQMLQAEYAVERLSSLGVAALVTPVEIKDGESYWVYLKPEMSEREAVRRLYELANKNIESHIIAKGELTNGISFGRYANYAEAEARSVEIKKQGYEPEIKMLPRKIRETWVVVAAGFAEKIDETVWADLISKESGLEKRQNFCLGVASK